MVMRVINGAAVVGALPTPPVRARVVRGHYSGGALREPGQVVDMPAAEFGELRSYGLVERAPENAPERVLEQAIEQDPAAPAAEPVKGKRK